jgi:hypothetical protein
VAIGVTGLHGGAFMEFVKKRVEVRLDFLCRVVVEITAIGLADICTYVVSELQKLDRLQ